MIHLRQAVVVEGKYDKIRLSALVDGPILVTNGFRIFKNREQLALLRRLARQDGILILTDSDAAGFKIRNYIKSAVPNGRIYQKEGRAQVLGRTYRAIRRKKRSRLYHQSAQYVGRKPTKSNRRKRTRQAAQIAYRRSAHERLGRRRNRVYPLANRQRQR